MDIEPTTMGGRKTLDLIQKNEIENRNSRQSNVNRSTIFEFIYFWSVFLLSISFFVDLTAYFCFYQKKNNTLSYHTTPFIFRIVSDTLFIAPLLLFIRYALTNSIKYYIIGILVFMPQLIFSLISLIQVYNQDFITSEDIQNYNGTNNTNLTNFLFSYLEDSNNGTNNNTDIKTLLTQTKVNTLKITPLINLFIYAITISLTYLKIIKNF